MSTVDREDEGEILDDTNAWRRLFAELLGTFLLVFVAAGADLVNARFGGHAIGTAARATAPGLMVAAIILFMGSVSGAHLNPVVTFAFAWRRDFPWTRVPSYLVVQALGATLAVLALVALLHEHGTVGMTLPGPGISPTTAMLWELILTVGLVSTILGNVFGCAERRAAQCDRCRRLHRARRPLRSTRERGVDEYRGARSPRPWC